MLQPLSTVNYYMATPISVFNGSDTIRGKNSYKGSGGLSSLTLGLGTKTFDWLYLGASFDVILHQIYLPVRDSGLLRMSSTEPVATMFPPSRPPSGPRSMM